MIKNVALICLLLVAGKLNGQARTSRTMELKPIQKQGWNYFYDYKKVTTPYALQIPLQALDDYQVNRYYHSFRTLQQFGELVSLIPLFYVLVQLREPYFDQRVFWPIVGGSILANLGFSIWSHNRLKNAIDLYNIKLLTPVGKNKVAGIGLSIRL